MCIADENYYRIELDSNSMDTNYFNSDQRSKKNYEKIKRREANMEKHKKYFAPLPALLEMMGASEDDEEKIEKKEVERKRKIEVEKKWSNLNYKEEMEKLELLFKRILKRNVNRQRRIDKNRKIRNIRVG